MIYDFKVLNHPQFEYDVQEKNDVVVEEDISYPSQMFSGNRCRILFSKYGPQDSEDLHGYIIIFQNMESEFAKVCENSFVASNHEEHQFNVTS